MDRTDYSTYLYYTGVDLVLVTHLYSILSEAALLICMKVYHNCARDNDNDNDDIQQNMNVSDGIKV